MASKNPALLQMDEVSVARPEDTRSKGQPLYLVVEGFTEQDYFEKIKASGMLRDGICLTVIEKKGIDLNETDRYRMTQIAEDQYFLINCGCETPHYVLTIILSDFLEFIVNSIEMGLNVPEVTEDDLKEIRSTMINGNLYKDYLDEDGFVNNIGGFVKYVSDYLRKKFGVQDYVLDNTDPLYDLDTDEVDWSDFYIVFDRDFSVKHFPDDVYEDLMEWSQSDGINMIVSTPAFELWLLMHFEGLVIPTFGNYTKSYKDYLANYLKGFDDYAVTNEKRINWDRFNSYYKKTIYTAINRSKSLEFEQPEDPPRNLIHKRGTCMGRFMESIIREKP